MKKSYRTLVVALSTIGCASSIAFGAAVSDDSAANLQRMQTQINGLQKQVKRMETKLSSKKAAQGEVTPSTDISASDTQGILQSSLPTQETFEKHLGDSVVIAPFVNKPTFYSGGQLVVNAPSINEDMKLLLRRYLNEIALLKNGKDGNIPSPRLVLSGKLEAQAIGTSPYYNPYSTDIDLSGAELDTLAEVTPWVNAFLALAYDNNPTNYSRGLDNRRTSNSRIYLDKGFITIGNFHQSSFYGSIGQMFVPFGRYESSMISSPLTKFIGKTKARAISISYVSQPKDNHITPYARVFGFKGDTKTGNDNLAKQYGADAGLWYGNSTWNGDMGASYIANLADAEGMQDNGVGTITSFRGYDRSDVQNLSHYVPGVSVHTNLAYTQYNLIAEYVTALTQFGQNNMTFNTHGAKPSALNVEGAYSFTLYRHPSTFGLGYGLSNQALALNIPQQRYSAVFATTFLTNTTFSLEYRYDKNYGKNDVATGGNLAGYDEKALGKHDNVITAEIGVYF